MGKTQIGSGTGLPGGGGGGGSTGFFVIQSPRITATTSTLVQKDFFGGAGDPYIVPFAGKIIKVSLSKFPGGIIGFMTLNILKQVGGIGALIPLGDLDVNGTIPDVQEFVVDYPFNAKDGFQFNASGQQAGSKFAVNLQIEYNLV